MPRRLNYTNRHKIKRDDISIQLRKETDGLFFDADLRLASYDLDKVTPQPHVYVEAYRGASALWKRFDFGRAGTIQAPEDRSLDEFGVLEGILFRVKVSAAGDGVLGRLLAEADAIRPRLPGECEEFGYPLIQHVPADDIGDEIWRVTDFDADLPLLKINNRVPMGVDQFLRDPLSRAVVMPAVMRQVLTRILVYYRDGYDEEDTSSWQTRWLGFASQLPGVSGVPEPEEEDGRLVNVEELERWVDEVVEAFVARSGLFSAAFVPMTEEGLS